MESKQFALFIAERLAEKKAEDVVILEVTHTLGYADFVVIAAARNPRQLAAMVGCRVETSIRILGQWVRANMIELKREGIVLMDLELILARGRAEPPEPPVEGGNNTGLAFAS